MNPEHEPDLSTPVSTDTADEQPARSVPAVPAALAEPLARSEPPAPALAEPVAQPPRPARQLNRPARWLVAAVEVAAVVGLAALAGWAWHRASIPVQLPEYENPAIPRSASRMSGPWAVAAVAAATLAGVLLLDAVREVLLAARAEHRTRSASAGAPHEDVESPQ